MGAIIVILLLILVIHFTGPLVLYLAAGAVALWVLLGIISNMGGSKKKCEPNDQ